MKTYQPWIVNGECLSKHPEGSFERMFWNFNISVWQAEIPINCQGLTYLDVGCSEGLYLSKFAQQGGSALGLDASDHFSAENDPLIGQLLDLHQPNFRKCKELVGGSYKGLRGGFTSDGRIVPSECDVTYNYVSCFNVLEYLPYPFKCLAHCLITTTRTLLIATDVCLDRPTYEVDIPNSSKRQWVFNLKDLLDIATSGWSTEARILDTQRGVFTRFQAVCIFRRKQ